MKWAKICYIDFTVVYFFGFDAVKYSVLNVQIHLDRLKIDIKILFWHIQKMSYCIYIIQECIVLSEFCKGCKIHYSNISIVCITAKSNLNIKRNTHFIYEKIIIINPKMTLLCSMSIVSFIFLH